jgi:hypothetical protein
MSSATAVSNTGAKVAKTKSVKKVKSEASTNVEVSAPSSHDDEGEVVVVDASASATADPPIDITVTVSDPTSDVESTPKKRAPRKKKDAAASAVVASITDMSQALSKLAEFEQSLKELASLISAMQTLKDAPEAQETKSAKPPKGFKKDGQPRKKAEYPYLALQPEFKSYLDTHNIVSTLQSEDAEFGAEFSDGKLHRLEIQQTFARVIKNLRAELPEDATKSTVEKTNKKGETVIDNTYYRISGDKMKGFFKMIGDIIVSKSASLDGEEKTKFATKVSEMSDKGYFTAIVKDDKVSKVTFPESICQQWQMAYFGFLTM